MRASSVVSPMCQKLPRAGAGMCASPAAPSLLAPQPPESCQEEASHPASQCLPPLLASPPGPGGLAKRACRRASGFGWPVCNKARVMQGGRELSSKRRRQSHALPCLGDQNSLLLQKTRLRDPTRVCRTHKTVTNLEKMEPSGRWPLPQCRQALQERCSPCPRMLLGGE